MNFQTRIKALFFDKPAVIAAVGAKTAKAMSRIGAFIRRRGRSLIRSAGKKNVSARPGQPPRYHTSDQVRTLRNIQFYYDPATKSVITGPILLSGKPAINKTVPNLLEFGGDITRKNAVTYHYSGNPFMAPALKAELDAGTIPEQFSTKASSTF